MSLIDYSFAERGDVLRVECAVRDGWQKGTETYRYREQITSSSDWLGHKLKITASVFNKPSSLTESASRYILRGVHKGGHSGVEFRLDDQSGRFDIRLTKNGVLNGDLLWKETEKNGKLCISWSHVVTTVSETGGESEQAKKGFVKARETLRLVAKLIDRQYRLDIFVVFDSPSSGPPPIVRDWFRKFYPGGLPSLGKRR
jgi:hypothetical protein